MHKVTAVIPAYNESGRIHRVLAVLADVAELERIIVVDDGSTDGTGEEVLEAARCDGRIELLRISGNRGKGQAVLAGVGASRPSYFLMLDADLMALNPRHVRELISPVTSGGADMTLGLFRGGHFTTDFGHLATPWLTGQRCLKTEILDYLTEETASGYGLEIALTVAAQMHDYRVARVIMRGVWHPSSEYHRGLREALRARRRMYREIWAAWIAMGGP
jgi:glycosyltransferase involved in cell wall biosynthesis